MNLINYNKLIALFEKSKVSYEILEHEAQGRSEEIAKIRGNEPQESCKSLLLRWKADGSKGYMLADLPGNQKLDLDKVKKLMNFKEVRMADQTELKNELNCVIGEVPPFGELFGLKTIIDRSLLKNKNIFFNAATLERSVKIKIENFMKIIEDNENYILDDILLA